MVNKGFAAVIIMSATAGGVQADVSKLCPQWTHSVGANVSGQGVIKAANSSRPDRVVGERTLPGDVKYSSGSFAVGDISSLMLKSSGSFSADMLLGAAMFLQASQTPVSRDIQEIVSEHFESYWD
ncbi:hypothetical protein ABRP17_016680 [Stenotrophomonas sp. WHRI 8082]|uniref:hypothetical protein n=1 Tax=Stenotrophomonas sp. WHRI 8082 TaxID=3162571 RepID=UPI0032EDCD9D